MIISNRGGLPETVTNAIILEKLDQNALYKELSNLIENNKKRLKLQKSSLVNFYLTNKFVCRQIDSYRSLINQKKIKSIKTKTKQNPSYYKL